MKETPLPFTVLAIIHTGLSITEKDFLNAINGILDYKEKQAQLTNTYYQQYLQILSAEKVYKLYQLEEEFNKILLKQLKDYPKEDKQNQKKRN